MLLIFLSLICFLFISDKKLLCQIKADSVWNEQEFERELYEINLMEFKHLLLKTDLDSTFKNQITSLCKQFIELANQKNYANANLILESTISLLTLWDTAAIFDEQPLDSDVELDEVTKTESNLQWIKEVTLGSDLWQQEFEISIPERDSSITEKTANPFIQLRLGFDYYHSDFSLKLDGSYKNSRDYFANELNVNLTRQLSSNTNLNFENRFENTSYKQTLNLAYWQNELSTDLEAKNIGKFSFDLKDEFLIRKNEPQSSGYADYFQNQFRLDGSYIGGSSLLLGGEYELENRSYPIYAEKDYRQHQLSLNYYGMLGLNYYMQFNIQYRYRDYGVAFNDTTYNIDYGEIYTDVNCAYRLNKLLTWKVENTIEYREYDLINSVSTDYLDFEIRPIIIFYFRDLWTIELGYIYSFRDYKEFNENTINEEDYYCHGISISIDLLQINNFMISLNDTYSFKRYPNSATKKISTFTLYSDRNINTLLCYFSWNIIKDLELGLIANLDSDRDPRRENSDARNTMFSIDLTFAF